MNEPKNILIIRTDRIGDVVLSLPMAAVIKKHYPNCKITFMLRAYTLPLADNNPDIDEIMLLKESSGKILISENLRRIKKRKFDSCFVVYPTFQLAVILFLSRIKNRIGTGYRWYSFLFNKKIFVHRKRGGLHELEHNINMLKTIGINEKLEPGSVPFNIQSTEKSRQKVEQVLADFNVNSDFPTIIIHPGSGGSSLDWPISAFTELAGIMARELNVNLLITGTVNEIETCSRLAVHTNIFNLAGKFDLDEMIALIDSADILIANSTGPIHIAAALGKYVIGFYPKINHCSQKRWGPFTNKKYIFEPAICDGQCTRDKCNKLNCMSSIKVENVFEKIKNILANNAE